MAKEGFFQKIKNFLFGESEEAISEFTQPEEADVSIQDAVISEIPSFKFSPTTVGTTDAPAEFYPHRVDEGREAPDIPEQYRVEHEPYRYEPDGDGTVCISKAHLYEIHPKSLLCVEMHPLAPLKIKASRDCVIYSAFSTDEQGKVIADPEKPDGAIYRLEKSATLPDSVQFELPDENGENGKEGKYTVPIVWVKNSKLYRHQWNEETDGREARLYGGLEGIRGPLHWHRGYNKIKNLGDGKNVYKKYVRDGKDEKEFRSIDERGQDNLSSPFSGEAQVKVKYSDDVQADADEIHVTGNEFNKHWKIDGKGVAIVEDGLVTCLNDLDCEEFPPVSLHTTTVISGVLGTTSILTSAGSVTVALEPQPSNMTSVVATSSVTTVAAPVTSGNRSDVSAVNSVIYALTAAPTTAGNTVSVLGSAVTATVAGVTTAGNMVSVLGSAVTATVAGVTTAGNMVSVLASAVTTNVAGVTTAGNMVSVLASAVTTNVAGVTTSGNMVSVLASAVTTNVAGVTTSGNMVSVLASAVTTNVAGVTTAGNMVSVLASAGTTTVAAPTTTGDTASVVGSVGTTSVALAPDATADKTDVWRGGTSSLAGGLTIVKVAACGNSGGSGDTCYWVMGVEVSGASVNTPPTFPNFITGSSPISVVKSLSTTSVINTTTPTNVIKSVPTTTVIGSVNSTSVVESVPTTTVIGSVNSTSVVESVPTTTVISSVNSTSVVESVPTTTVIGSVNSTSVVESVPTTTVIGSVNSTSVVESVPTTTVIGSVNSTSVVESVPTHLFVKDVTTVTTSVVTSTTPASVVASTTPVSVVASLNTTSVVATVGSTTTPVITGAVTTEVYAPTGTLHKTVLESPSSNSASDPVKVVKCPTTNLCPEE